MTASFPHLGLLEVRFLADVAGGNAILPGLVLERVDHALHFTLAFLELRNGVGGIERRAEARR